MGLFKDIFGKSDETVGAKVHWNYLESLEDLEAAEAVSTEKTVILFKHSTRCSISRFVLKQFENTFDLPAEDMELYFLDLIQYRSVSNEIATRYGVMHQSPQMIVLKDRNSVYDASHEGIETRSLKQFI